MPQRRYIPLAEIAFDGCKPSIKLKAWRYYLGKKSFANTIVYVGIAPAQQPIQVHFDKV